MYIFKVDHHVTIRELKERQTLIKNMMKEGVVVIPEDVDLVYSSEEEPEKKPFGFSTECVGFDIYDPEKEED